MSATFDAIRKLLEKNSGAHNLRGEEDLQISVFDLLESVVPAFGWADYNDASTAAVPIVLSSGVWTNLPNDGEGSFTRTDRLPEGITSLLDVSTGRIDPTQLGVNSIMLFRYDIEIITPSNNTQVELRMHFGYGQGWAYQVAMANPAVYKTAGTYNLAGISGLYIGSAFEQSNPIGLEIRSDAATTVENRGAWMVVFDV